LNAQISAITIIPSQIRQGITLNRQYGLSNRIDMIFSDYTNTGLDSESLDAAYAIGSACHDAVVDNYALLSEMVRTLKPGATLVISDSFRTSKTLPT